MSETFYGQFYGFDSPPFHITPDPSLLFSTETHRQALGAIEYGIASGKGFIVVTGEVGVGKTTVLRMCLDKQLDSSKIKIIYLFNPALAVPELYAAILEELDDPHEATLIPAGVLRRLLRALVATHRTGTQVVLAVDEAQNMPEKTLEGLRILSNLETAKSKLLQIILVGQPELEAKLAKHSLRQLAQRVAVRARIKPLTWRQSCRYIQHRSRCAGRNRPLFTAPALWYLAITARGIPRSINILCDNALINGYGYAAERISLRIARESCRSLEFRSPFRRIVVLGAAALVIIVASFLGNTVLQQFLASYARDKALESALRERPALTIANLPKAPAPPNVAAASLPSLPRVAAEPLRAPLASVAQAATSEPEDHLAIASTTMKMSPETPAESPASMRAQAIHGSVPTHEPSQVATDSTPAKPKNQSGWKWFVRRGDSVYKACWAGYGLCDKHTLRTILAYNPQIGSNGMIRQGMIITMPGRAELARSNGD